VISPCLRAAGAPGRGDTGSIGVVFSRARCSSGWKGFTGRLGVLVKEAGVDEGEEILEAAAPVGIIIVGSLAVSLFLGIGGRLGSGEVPSRGLSGISEGVARAGKTSDERLVRGGLKSSTAGGGGSDFTTGLGSTYSGSASKTVITSTSTTSGGSSSINSAVTDSLFDSTLTLSPSGCCSAAF
jgi:hypothetical protein